MVNALGLSQDGSALVVDGIEKQACCHFCSDMQPFRVPFTDPLNTSLIYNKPNKWALIRGGTQRKLKRFFICEKCAKVVVHAKL